MAMLVSWVASAKGNSVSSFSSTRLSEDLTSGGSKLQRFTQVNVGGCSKRKGLAVRASSSSSTLSESTHTTPGSLYELLGISSHVSRATIKEAYRQMARKYHPDVRPKDITVEECTRRFIEVQEAYEILSDPQRRATYDFELRSPALRRDKQGWRKAVWQRQHRSHGQGPAWSAPDDVNRTSAEWRGQWKRQLDGLNQRSAKPMSWAARVRQQQEEREE